MNVPAVTPGELKHSFESSVRWLSDNKQRIFRTHNSALWWMIKEAEDLTDNPTLTSIYQQYRREQLQTRPRNLWTPFFNPGYKPYVPDIDLLSDLKPYQILFAYALSCDTELGNEPLIKRQLQSDYCQHSLINARCVTHQQMGVFLLEQNGCGDHKRLASELLDIIESDLSLDFRVTDSYLQRALTLAQGGRSQAIKPVWVRKIMQAQSEDGGWGDYYPVIDLAGIKLGFSSRPTPVIGPGKSDFHATAQGLLLMALLLDDDKQRDDDEQRH